MTQKILKIAVPTPLNRVFDYLPPKNHDIAGLLPGMRLLVPFGRTTVSAILLDISGESDLDISKLKTVRGVIDDQPLFDEKLMRLLRWAIRYYHHPPGQVCSAALPAALRTGKALPEPGQQIWQLTDAGKLIDIAALKRAPRQAELLQVISQTGDAANQEALQSCQNWRSTLRTLIEKGWVKTSRTEIRSAATSVTLTRKDPPELNPGQQACVDRVLGNIGQFGCYLLDGITGSGKTEVYLALADTLIAANRQVLVLVPEIGLTPQLVERFSARFTRPPAVLHSGLNDTQRLQAWHRAWTGEADIVIGTRSAVFTPLPKAGAIIIDEEHDASFKQQEGFRYHARDIAIMRARDLDIPVILGSATPSLESLHNVTLDRYSPLHLPSRHGHAALPAIRAVDLRCQPMLGILSRTLIDMMQRHLSQGYQVLLFLNRRGYAPVLICHSCGWLARCDQCDAHMVYHQSGRQVRCHHCDTCRPVDTACPECGDHDLRNLGFGTERLEETLMSQFPGHEVIRVDRDSTRKKDSMARLYEKIRHGSGQILLGTQMLAKGHDLPNVTLAAVLDADQGLFGTDFRATERMGQLIIQVAGRAGRGETPGEVIIQTHHPDHPLIQSLLNHDYPQFARDLLEERMQAGLPPYGYLALFRADATSSGEAICFLENLRQRSEPGRPDDTRLLGPVAAAMERRANRYRARLLLQAGSRKALHGLVNHCLTQITELGDQRRIRWSVDIDPQETA